MLEQEETAGTQEVVDHQEVEAAGEMVAVSTGEAAVQVTVMTKRQSGQDRWAVPVAQT